jgi:hypothetical protein
MDGTNVLSSYVNQPAVEQMLDLLGGDARKGIDEVAPVFAECPVRPENNVLSRRWRNQQGERNTMNKILIITAKAVLPLALILAATNLLQAQTTKESGNGLAPTSNTQTVNAQQAGAWTVGIDQAKNAVKLQSSDTEPVTVKLVGTGVGRKPFQFRMLVNVATGSITESGTMSIPAGKRLVIENISAIARTGAGIRMQMQLFSYFDNGDGIGDVSDITFHRIAVIDQGTYDGVYTASGNHKVLVFADEQIGSAHFGLTLQVRLDAPAAGGINQGQVTLSGYVEDLPVVL